MQELNQRRLVVADNSHVTLRFQGEIIVHERTRTLPGNYNCWTSYAITLCADSASSNNSAISSRPILRADSLAVRPELSVLLKSRFGASNNAWILFANPSQSAE